jgi:hypothetical protein
MKSEKRTRIQKQIDELTGKPTEYGIYAPIVERGR